MKTIKLLLVFVSFLMTSQIGISQNKMSQTTKIYLVDFAGTATEKVVKTTEVPLHFNSDVPKLNDQQVSQLLKNGKIEVSEKKIKGHYEQFILFYVPHVEADSCFLSKDGLVSYQGFKPKNESRMFSWWYLFALAGIGCMIVYHKEYNKKKCNNINVIGLTFLFAILFTFALALAISTLAVFAFVSFAILLVFTFIFMVTMSLTESKKVINICVWIYYICIAFCLYTCIFAVVN